MKYAIVTGTSRGLGESTAKYFLEQGIHVVGISRNANNDLAALAKANNMTYEHFTCDLGDIKEIEDTSQHISEHIFKDDISTLYLVNNAAVVDPIDQSMNISSNDLAHHVQVNTVAPMVLMNLFLKKTADFAVPMVGVTVTSGAADRPVYGWSAYCTTKASMKMYIQTVALEQDTLKTENKVIAFNPGVMDTAMQEKLRATSPEQFAEVDSFKAYKENNLLKNTANIAGILVDILTDGANLQNGKTYHAEEYL